MDLRKTLVCVLVIVLLMGAVTVAFAQEPEAADPTAELDAIATGLTAEPVPLGVNTMMYLLPKDTTFEQVSAAYTTAMAEAGWKEDTESLPAPGEGINALSWLMDDLGFAVIYIPAIKDNPPQLITLLAWPETGEEAMTEEGTTEEGAAAEGVAEESEAGAAMPGCPCCQELAAGTGGLWFENFMGDVARYDITGPDNKQIEVPAKQGETSGCLFVALKAGAYHVQGKTDWGGQVDFDVDVAEGEVLNIPIAVEGT